MKQGVADEEKIGVFFLWEKQWKWALRRGSVLGEYGMNQYVMCISGLVVAKVLIFFCVI